MTRRAAAALQNRTKLPQDILVDTVVKIQEIKGTTSEEEIDHGFENHQVFKQEQDEQLVNWFSRYVYLQYIYINNNIWHLHSSVDESQSYV